MATERNYLLVRDHSSHLQLLRENAANIERKLNCIDPGILNEDLKKGRSVSEIAKNTFNYYKNSAPSKLRYYRALQNRIHEISLKKAIQTIYNLTESKAELIAKKITEKFIFKEASKTDDLVDKYELQYRNLFGDISKIIFYVDNTKNETRRVHFEVMFLAKGGFYTIYSASTHEFSLKTNSSVLTETVTKILDPSATEEQKLKEIQSPEIQQLLLRSESDRLITASPELLINNEDATVFVQKKYICDLSHIFNRKKHAALASDSKWLCDMILNIASALLHMHEKGYTHRDLKPENIFISDNLRARLADFGLFAELGENSRPSGTHYFIPCKYLSAAIGELGYRGKIKQGKDQDAFALAIILAMASLGKEIYRFLPSFDNLSDNTHALIDTIQKSRAKISSETKYDINNRLIFSADINKKVLSILKSKILRKISQNGYSHIPLSSIMDSKNYSYFLSLAMKNRETFIKQLQTVDNSHDLENLITSTSFLSENIKKELILDIRFFDESFKIFIDAINGDVKTDRRRPPMSIHEIITRLNKIKSDFAHDKYFS